ncbi:hypothetical protein [Chryseobacterium sp.]|uniref:hypothetical protein n=1 Tax=Chryseobacterium sp. TaxID=1871047 RepID=UPI0028979BC4|nr:hypothetical protein [Chryseobacterium sp.]
MSNDKFQDKYNEVFQSLKEEKMNWDFEDFLKKAEGKEDSSSDETPIISIDKKEKPTFPKWFWMAASVVILFGMALVFNFNQNEISDRENLVKNEVLKQKNDFIAENHEHQTQMAVHTVDSVAGAKQDSIFVENSIAEKDVLDEILSKKSRIKKDIKPRYVQNSLAKDSAEYQDSYVIVNGKKITNKQEALDVTTFSFMKMGREFNKTVASSHKNDDYTTEY